MRTALVLTLLLSSLHNSLRPELYGLTLASAWAESRNTLAVCRVTLDIVVRLASPFAQPPTKKNHEQVRSTGLGVFRSCRLKAYFGTMINVCHEVRDRSRPSATQKKHLATNSTHFAAKWGGNSSITLEVTFRHRRVCGRPARLIERARNSWPCADSQRGLRGYVFQHKVEMHSALVGRSRRPADKSH